MSTATAHPEPTYLTEVFESNYPWGSYAPEGMAAAVISACQRLPAHPPLFYSLIKALRGPLKQAPSRVYDVDVLGLRLRLLNSGNYCETTALFAPQFYDRAELNWIANQLSAEGDTGEPVFVDIGGNVGLYSLVTAARCPDVRIITVEPDPLLAARMAFNAATNGLSVEHQGVALSDFNGTAELQRSPHQSGANQLAVGNEGGAEVQTPSDVPGRFPVPVRTLVALCDDLSINRIDVLKIDIEGHEKPVLDHFFTHADQSLWPRGIVIEQTHDHDGVVAGLTAHYGYRAAILSKRNVMLHRG